VTTAEVTRSKTNS